MGKLILIRHGQSMWNLKNVFTGWVDVPLSEQGIHEAIQAGKQLSEISFDVVFTSMQIRAAETAMIALAQNKSDKTPILLHSKGQLEEWSRIYDQKMIDNMIPVHHNWHLNERYYGELQGKNKEETAKEFGEAQVYQWRRSYDIPPPKGESLKDTAERTIPFFEKEVVPELEKGKNILISAHGNSLRSIVMHIDHLSKEEVIELEIQTGQPIIYDYENNQLISNK
ncbi:2,3-bisphosphoglycerate-dependent phosphoglycerate mutase [Flammeovirga agarivorans]|uniref:2,3-bisphosphoglycerate-dependent phosphoglycerate mutase n=1 Tax=Flammeovirga agarivorans TaxID=2726742 RepID=A0A7X8SRB6_9BACT|nr:2,3-bisphosphoglycerate-dependent phosphoglycerate mutase [Flammeovirga agarivorans]NLR94976.1 2,3-bisphosphoglycerate-dependent phosphoglycerate mutase [Flammeovirga agarivorans]